MRVSMDTCLVWESRRWMSSRTSSTVELISFTMMVFVRLSISKRPCLVKSFSDVGFQLFRPSIAELDRPRHRHLKLFHDAFGL